MANFEIAYQITMGHEGKYSNNPKDRGGETYKGIARNFHPNWPGWKLIDVLDKRSPNFQRNLSGIKFRLEQYVKPFYEQHFWKAISLDQVNNQQIANELFDTAVNMGLAAPIADLQRSLNILNRNGRSYPDLRVDGKMGPITLARLNGHTHPSRVFNCLNGFQFMRYVRICENDPTQEEFFNGWLSRVQIMQ